MTQPKTSAAYPAAMLHAVSRAMIEGEFSIPCEKPRALLLRFQGLRGALRLEKRADDIDLVSFHLGDNPPSVIIRAKEDDPSTRAILTALAAPVGGKPPTTSTDDAEAALARILGGEKP